VRLEKKVLLGKKESDPKWIQDIACYFFTYGKNRESDEYKSRLRELFFEYKEEGMEPNKAWKKAKKVLECFEF